VDRRQAEADHHLWLCTNPTPNAAAARRRFSTGD
jgi:hypothetical protein